MRKKLLFVISLSVLMLSTGLVLQSRALPSAYQETPSLYKRLGGYDALAAVTDDFIMRLATDKSLGRFFTGASKDSQKKIRTHVVDLLCEATGGPCIYIGRTMKVSHAGLGITEADWTTAAKHLGDTLDKFKVPAAEKAEVFKIVGTLKADIVEKP
ncbi:MAG: hemoglobin [Acidobacteriota bacterium]|jgi:hemoglobin|nr:hemoglobin [Acidobacteriota bacterium]